MPDLISEDQALRDALRKLAECASEYLKTESWERSHPLELEEIRCRKYDLYEAIAEARVKLNA